MNELSKMHLGQKDATYCPMQNLQNSLQRPRSFDPLSDLLKKMIDLLKPCMQCIDCIYWGSYQSARNIQDWGWGAYHGSESLDLLI